VPYNSRTPSGGSQAAHSYPITRAFALTVLAALAILIVLRHLFGSIRVDVGAR
jgi:hypothetical protein